jgi:fatty acid desaturase
MAVVTRNVAWLVWYWVWPNFFAVPLANVRALSEHTGTSGKGDAILTTRTVTSNPLVSFLMCSLNDRLEPHLFPGISWYNLPRIHRPSQAVL